MVKPKAKNGAAKAAAKVLSKKKGPRKGRAKKISAKKVSAKKKSTSYKDIGNHVATVVAKSEAVLKKERLSLGLQQKPEKPVTHPKRLTVKELQTRLKEARAKNKELAKQGKLKNPTKAWSKDSIESLSKALSESEK